MLGKEKGEGISYFFSFFFFSIWREVGHWERGGMVVMGKEREQTDPEEKESALE